MKANFELLESQLSETEMALLAAVNVALNASLIAGADPNINLLHLRQHEENFTKLGQSKAANLMAAIQELHKATAGLR